MLMAHPRGFEPLTSAFGGSPWSRGSFRFQPLSHAQRTYIALTKGHRAMKATLTQAVVDKATAKAKAYEIRDTKLTGFLLRIQPTGKKTYYCEYRRGARLKIGPESALSVKSARKRAKEILAQYYQGGEPAIVMKKAKAMPTYGEFLRQHYFSWVDANHSSAKSTKRRLTVDCAVFQKLKLDAITPQRVEKWRTAKVASGLSPHAANRCYNAFRASLSKAEEWGFLKEHPLRKMKPLKADSNLKIRYLSKNEEQRLRAALDQREETMKCHRDSGNQWREQRNIDPMRNFNTVAFCDHIKPMVLLSMNTGMRRGEVFSLKWQNIDFNLKQLTIEGTNTKSRKARYIPLNNEAYNTLLLWQSQLQVHAEYVFVNKNNQPFKDVKKAWKALLVKAEIENFRWHDLRHHFASKLAMAGVDLNTVRECSLIGGA